MKIVINSCFGGFGLSHAAVKRYAELCGFDVYPFRDEKYDGNYKLIPDKEVGDAIFVTYFLVPNPGELLEQAGEDRDTLYQEIEFYPRDLKRDDQTLIQVVEELGDKANGRFAKLSIVEVPDDVDWFIDEYYGSEYVAERHRTWS